MKPIARFVCFVGLAGLGALTVNSAYAQARGPAGRPGLNALSTTVYGTPITPTNQGPVGPRPRGGVLPGFPSSWLPQTQMGTSSTNATNSLLRNSPYSGSATGIGAGGSGLTVPQYNGTGNSTGLLPTNPYSSGRLGPVFIPESLGNPTPNGQNTMPNGQNPAGMNNSALGNGPNSMATFDYRSLSAYGDLERNGQQTVPPGYWRTDYRTLGDRPESGTPFDFRSLSAYGDLERNGQQTVPMGNSSTSNQSGPRKDAAPASGTPHSSGSQPAQNAAPAGNGQRPQ
jgi:hypothetical protein